MTLTAAEQTFISRMADEIVRNPSLSMEDAAKAVLARDQELWLMATANTDQGKTIRSTLAQQTYEALRR